MATCVRYASAGQRRECGRMRCKRTPAVGTWPSAARTVLGWQEGGRTCVVRADRRGKGSGPEVPRSGKELSSARAEAKEVNISEGSLGGGPSRKPIPLLAKRWSKDSRKRSPPVPARVCSRSPVKIWRHARARQVARIVKPA